MVEFQLPKLITRVRFPSLAPIFMGLVVPALLLGGCASVEQMPTVTGPMTASGRPSGVYHKVQKGETLWRIAKVYNVNVDDLVRVNRIPNIAQLEVNQLIFIPGATQELTIPAAAAGTAAAPAVRDDEFGWPLRGKVIGYFSQRDSRFNENGISIEAQPGQAVTASRSGKVVLADYLSGYAQTVIIDHQDGYASVYGQNGRLLVRQGETVTKGTPIAEVANQGSLTHLYFEIRKNAVADNPLFYLSRAEEVR